MAFASIPLQPRARTALRDTDGARARRCRDPEPPLMERLWRTVAQEIARNPLPEQRVLVVGFGPDLLAWLRDTLRALDVRLVASCADVRQLGSVPDMRPSFSLVIVNLDAFADAEAAVDAMLLLREDAPEITSVLMSSRVAQDDLGRERRPICDATLRWPVTASRLRAGLLAALANHAVEG